MKTTQQTKFKNKNGDVSSYALLCGYSQREESNNYYKELYMEHSHFHVRHGKTGERFTGWETFDANQLTLARKNFRQIKI